MEIAVVRLQARETRGTVQYSVTVPKKLVDQLGWRKGDTLLARILEIDIDGKTRKVLVYYKP